jgi:hypothetical protein
MTRNCRKAAAPPLCLQHAFVPAPASLGCKPWPSVFVVVAFMCGVPVSVVHVVQMVAVQDGGVTASLAMHVNVLLGRLMQR